METAHTRTERRGEPPGRGTEGRELLQLKGIKDQRRMALVREGIVSIEDLLWNVPYGYIDRSTVVPISRLRDVATRDPKREVTVVARVVNVRPVIRRGGGRFLTLTVSDASGFPLKCYWFNGVQYFENAFQVGEILALSAVPAWDKRGQDVIFTHPKFDRFRSTEEGEPDWDRMFNTGRIIPKYSSTAELQKAGLDSSRLRWIIRTALKQHLPRIAECLPEHIRVKHLLPTRQSALASLHLPENIQEIAAARQRFSYEELFFLQLMYARLRHEIKSRTRSRRIDTHGALLSRFYDQLPFTLTGAQRRVLAEIAADLASDQPMNRLLQGDVGSGKTVVALAGSLMAIESGLQAAIMAPTELLAEQHFRTATTLMEGLPVNVRLLVGGQKKKLREDVLEDIRSGRAHLVIGTHALLEGKVDFASLGFVVIDEQHRFGVEQRGTLAAKGSVPDLLVMSATPIPRTLQMVKFSDLDVSRLDEMPAGRKPVRTAVRQEHEKQRVFDFIRQEAKHGRQSYIVYPLIDESDRVEWKAATAHFEELKKRTLAGLRVALLHGRMKSAEKDEVMRQFKAGEYDVLVSTTVIEVGIDVPNATMMLIENAERFGLAQLHQLRGRVGRGSDESYCVLATSLSWSKHEEQRALAQTETLLQQIGAHATPTPEFETDRERSLARLFSMQRTTDGFVIAEMDLALRSSFFLTFDEQQSGMKRFKFVEMPDDMHLLPLARQDAFELIERDPQLRSSENEIVAKEFATRFFEDYELGKIL